MTLPQNVAFLSIQDKLIELDIAAHVKLVSTPHESSVYVNLVDESPALANEVVEALRCYTDVSCVGHKKQPYTGSGECALTEVIVDRVFSDDIKERAKDDLVSMGVLDSSPRSQAAPGYLPYKFAINRYLLGSLPRAENSGNLSFFSHC